MARGLKAISIIITLLVLSPLPLRSESSTNDNFFLVTFNAESWISTIWEINQTEDSFESIYIVPGTKPVSARSDFPADEMTKLDNIQAQGSLPFIDPDNPGIGHHIDSAWLIDLHRLLVLERNEVCDRVNGGYCYGYFEFVMLNLSNGQTTSIHRIGFHDDIYDSWECPNVRGLFVDEVLVNPLFDQVAFSVTSDKWCYDEKSVPSAGYIVDFSGTSVQVTTLPHADGLSWSPDGKRLAYFVRSSCKDNQNASVNVLPVNPPAETIILREEAQYCRNDMFLHWLDNENVIYLWKPEQGDTPSTLYYQNVTSYTCMSDINIVADFFRENIKIGPFNLTDTDSASMVALNGNNQLIEFSADNNSVIHTLPVFTNRVFYNSRFPEHLYTNIEDTVIQRIDASLIITEIDLEPFFEEHPQEWISYITSG